MKKTNEKGIAHPEFLVLLIVLVLVGGAGFYVFKSQQTDAPTNSLSSESVSYADKLPEDLSVVLPIDKLNEIIGARSEGGELAEVELKTEDGLLVYEAKLTNEKLLIINAKTGEVISVSEFDSEAPMVAMSAINISIQEAINIARSKHSGDIRKVELETEDGRTVISVRFSDKYRVDIDATTGEITRTKDADDTGSKDDSGKGSDDDEDEDDDDDSGKGSDDDEDEDDDDDSGKGSDDDEDEDDDDDSGKGSDDDEDEDDDDDSGKGSDDDEDDN